MLHAPRPAFAPMDHTPTESHSPMQEPMQEPSSRDTRLDAGQSPAFLYEPVERFGKSMTANLPWNVTALAGVELLNGRVAMLGFAAALVGELLTGKGMVGQLGLMLQWYLS